MPILITLKSLHNYLLSLQGISLKTHTFPNINHGTLKSHHIIERYFTRVSRYAISLNPFRWYNEPTKKSIANVAIIHSLNF